MQRVLAALPGSIAGAACQQRALAVRGRQLPGDTTFKSIVLISPSFRENRVAFVRTRSRYSGSLPAPGSIESTAIA
jgi:hypothetical protein